MTRIVAAVFDDEAAATSAAYELRRAGFEAGDLDQFTLNPAGQHGTHPLGGDRDADSQSSGAEESAAAGAAVCGVLGAAVGLAAVPLVGPVAIAGALTTGALLGAVPAGVKAMGDNAENRGNQQPITRPAGVMVAVNTEFEEDEEVAIDLLRHGGARMVERAEGSWHNGRWGDFDPVAAPRVVDKAA